LQHVVEAISALEIVTKSDIVIFQLSPATELVTVATLSKWVLCHQCHTKEKFVHRKEGKHH